MPSSLWLVRSIVILTWLGQSPDFFVRGTSSLLADRRTAYLLHLVFVEISFGFSDFVSATLRPLFPPAVGILALLPLPPGKLTPHCGAHWHDITWGALQLPQGSGVFRQERPVPLDFEKGRPSRWRMGPSPQPVWGQVWADLGRECSSGIGREGGGGQEATREGDKRGARHRGELGRRQHPDLPGNQAQAHRQDIYKTAPLTSFHSFHDKEAEQG